MKTENNNEVFDELNAVNVNGHTEKKTTDGGRTTLTYLSWPWAWAEVKKRYPNAVYDVKKFDGIPYVVTPLGIMVYTSVTINDVTHEMWLPVMDSKNKAMKTEAYKYHTYSGDKTVEAATMFDVNKTIMRCLVKNLAMFGLGLYIYAGEDIPEDSEQSPSIQQHTKGITSAQKMVEKSIGPSVWQKYKSSADPALSEAEVKSMFAALVTEVTGKTHSNEVSNSEWEKVLERIAA